MEARNLRKPGSQGSLEAQEAGKLGSKEVWRAKVAEEDGSQKPQEAGEAK